jgi:hypothetical protein
VQLLPFFLGRFVLDYRNSENHVDGAFFNMMMNKMMMYKMMNVLLSPQLYYHLLRMNAMVIA